MLAEPTVFVVDDDGAMRDSLRWLLESVNFVQNRYHHYSRLKCDCRQSGGTPNSKLVPRGPIYATRRRN